MFLLYTLQNRKQAKIVKIYLFKSTLLHKLTILFCNFINLSHLENTYTNSCLKLMTINHSR